MTQPYRIAAAERPAPDPAHVACDKALDKALDDHDVALGEIERLKARLAAAERPVVRETLLLVDRGLGYLRANWRRLTAEDIDDNLRNQLARVGKLRLAAAERPQDARRCRRRIHRFRADSI